MSDTADVQVEALAEPERNVRGLFMAGLALANLGIMVAFFAPLQNLLPRMSEQISGPTGKEAALAIVTGVGVIGSVIGNPLAGALSDRTTSRWGRRRPWMLGGSLLGFVGLILLPNMNTIWSLTIAWLAVQFAVNAAYAGLTATIPDQVPVRQRGVASGLVGLAILGVDEICEAGNGAGPPAGKPGPWDVSAAAAGSRPSPSGVSGFLRYLFRTLGFGLSFFFSGGGGTFKVVLAVALDLGAFLVASSLSSFFLPRAAIRRPTALLSTVLE